MSDFHEGLAVVCNGEGGCACGYIDKMGGFAFAPTLCDAHDFSEGLAAVSSNGKWGYIDKTGKFVIDPQFDNVADTIVSGDFHEGLAFVQVGGKYGYIDKTGAYIFKLQFDEVAGFKEGMAAVKFNGKWGYIKNPNKPR
jgi:hypothetical protein